jgi:predicted homoserine dehydrogenase-like protein
VKASEQVINSSPGDLRPAICSTEMAATRFGASLCRGAQLAEDGLPICLAYHVLLKRDIVAGAIVRWSDVAVPDTEAVAVQRKMQRRLAPETCMAAQ